jgi:hypothetical protein
MIDLYVLKVTLQLTLALLEAHCLMMLFEQVLPFQKMNVATAPAS